MAQARDIGSYIGNIALEVGQNLSKRSSDIADIITFVESSWGLKQKLFPVQRVILKAHYGLKLDDCPYGIDVTKPVPKDHPNYDEITTISANLDNSENGYYKHRVVITDWHRKNPRAFTEAEYLRHLYNSGRCNIPEVKEGQERRELVLALGRRSGKTQMASCIAAYETYKLIRKVNPQFYYGLPSGEEIRIVSVATGKDQASILYSKVSGYYKDCDFFAAYKANNTTMYAKFQTPRDIDRFGRHSDNEKALATIKVTFLPCKGRNLRGFGNIVVILDEIAHFLNEGQSSAEDVYNAVRPSLAAFSPKDPKDKSIPIGPVEGRMISISSPLGKQGQFYKLFQEAMSGGPSAHNMLAIQAPTWEINPTVPASEFEVAYYKDAVVFDTEFGASFNDQTCGFFPQPADLVACIDPKRKPVVRASTRQSHFAGLDIALAGDGTAIAIGHIDDQNKIVLDIIDYIRAGEGKYSHVERLDYDDDIVSWIYDYTKRFPIASGVFDQYCGIIFEQALNKRGLNQFRKEHFTPILHSQVWKNLKDMVYDQSLALYDWPIPENKVNGEHCPYITELLELQVEYKTKYTFEVAKPRMEGKFDDMSDALARMVWEASQSLGSRKQILFAKSRTQGGNYSHRQPQQIYQGMMRSRKGIGSSYERQSNIRPIRSY